MDGRRGEFERRAAIHGALGDPHRLAIIDALSLSDGVARADAVESNLLAHHFDVLEGAGVLERSASQGDRRRHSERGFDDAFDELEHRIGTLASLVVAR